VHFAAYIMVLHHIFSSCPEELPKKVYKSSIFFPFLCANLPPFSCMG
jgi:hypothetical protein